MVLERILFQLRFEVTGVPFFLLSFILRLEQLRHDVLFALLFLQDHAFLDHSLGVLFFLRDSLFDGV